MNSTKKKPLRLSASSYTISHCVIESVFAIMYMCWAFRI